MKTIEPGNVPGSPEIMDEVVADHLRQPGDLTPSGGAVDPWFCVTGFHRFCLCRFFCQSDYSRARRNRAYQFVNSTIQNCKSFAFSEE